MGTSWVSWELVGTSWELCRNLNGPMGTSWELVGTSWELEGSHGNIVGTWRVPWELRGNFVGT